jgi:hypothetical protein
VLQKGCSSSGIAHEAYGKACRKAEKDGGCGMLAVNVVGAVGAGRWWLAFGGWPSAAVYFAAQPAQRHSTT